MRNQNNLSSTEEAESAKKTITRWIYQDFLSIIEEADVLPEVVANLPSDMSRGNALKIKELNSLSLDGMKLLSLQLSRVMVELSVKIHMGIDVSWDDYKSSHEARTFVGETDEEFISTTVFFDSQVQVTLELELLKVPPMVVSYRLKKIIGEATSVEYE
jgi:hypothetical protein